MTNAMRSKEPARKKVAVTLRLDAALVQRWREFVRNEAGKPLFLTPAKFMEAAITAHLERLDSSLSEGSHRGARNDSPTRERR